MDKPLISPSSISTYVDCPRKWAWRKLAKIPAPPNKYAERGLVLHDIAEAFLKDGTPPPDTEIGRCFRAGLKHLPAPGQCIVEGGGENFRWFPDGEVFGFTGRMDWIEPDIPRVGDHKSTGDLKWAKTVDQLRKDIPAIIYSAYVLGKYNAQRVEGRWVYYLMGTRPQARAVDFAFSREEILEKMGPIVILARQMAGILALEPDVLDLDYDVEACGKYGGCPYATQCNLSPKERMLALMAPVSMKEKLMARVKAAQEKAAQKGSVQEATEPAEKAPINPPESEIVVDVEPAPAPKTCSGACASPGAATELMTIRVLEALGNSILSVAKELKG